MDLPPVFDFVSSMKQDFLSDALDPWYLPDKGRDKNDFGVSNKIDSDGQVADNFGVCERESFSWLFDLFELGVPVSSEDGVKGDEVATLHNDNFGIVDSGDLPWRFAMGDLELSFSGKIWHELQAGESE